jgi:outer membrane receptor protein involved in Fe transport
MSCSSSARAAAVALCFCLLAPAGLQAQQPDTTPKIVLPTLEVTGSRERAAPPPVVTVDLTPAVVQHTLHADPYDLIRRAAVVEVHAQGQGPGFASDVVVRGFTSDHAADVLLVVDGVPINLPVHGHGEGYADWNSLLPAAVRSLRLLYGTASPLYGDFALGGVVEVVTDADAVGTRTAVTGASYGGVGGWLRTGQHGEQSGWMAAGDGRFDNGWRPNSDYWLGNALLRGWRRVGRGRLEGGLGLYGTSWNSPGFVTVEQFNAGDFDFAADSTDGGDAFRGVAHVRYATPLGQRTSGSLTAWLTGSEWNLFLNIPEDEEGPVTQTGEQDTRIGTGGQAAITWLPTAGEFTFGLDWRHESADFWQAHTVARETVEPEADYAASYSAAAPFVRWRRTFNDRFGLDLGARLDAVRYESRDVLGGGETESHDRVIVNPKLGARYLLSGSVALLGSLSHGIRGAPGVIGDPARPPLEAWAGELALEWLPGTVELHVAAFRMDVSNERILDPITLEISSAGSSRRQGLDLRGRLPITGHLTLTAAGTWNDAHLTDAAADTHTEERRGAITAHTFRHDEALSDDVPGVAEYTAQAGLEAIVGPKLLANAAVRVLGPYTPIGEPEIRTKAYGVLDLSATYSINDALTMDFGIENVFDRDYPELRSSGYINPGLPRTLRAAMTWSGGGH